MLCYSYEVIRNAYWSNSYITAPPTKIAVILIMRFLLNRVGGGFWRRGGEAPTAVKWEDRVIQICEGSWSYVIGSSSIGRSPGMHLFFMSATFPRRSFPLHTERFIDSLVLETQMVICSLS